jgi:hypothetical protein
MDTIAHEMGHNLGRNHAPGCNSDGADTRFPYPNTGVGVDGYSLGERTRGVPHLPNAPGPFKSKAMFKDVMGYCYPTWISDYTWNAFADRIRIVNGFPPVTVTSSPPPRSLRGYYTPGKAPYWIVVRGGNVPAGTPITELRSATITAADGSLSIAPVAVDLRWSPAGPEDRARTITVALPDQRVNQIDVAVDGERFTVGPSILGGP